MSTTTTSKSIEIIPNSTPTTTITTTPSTTIETISKPSSSKELSPPFLLKVRSSTTFIATTVALGVLVDLAGYGIITPVIPFRLAELGYDDIGSKVGWLVSSYALGLIGSTPFIAYLGSKFEKSRRIPLILSLLMMAAGLIMFMETNSYQLMIVSRILQGISGTGLWSLGLALITDSVPSARVGIVMGYVMIGFSVGSLIGPPVGGVLYERLGYRSVFIFALILVFFDLMLRLLIIEKHIALQWIEKGIEIEGFEAPGYTARVEGVKQEVGMESNSEKVEGRISNNVPTSSSSSSSSSETINVESSIPSSSETLTSESKKPATVWSGLKILLTSGRPVSLFLLTMLNGFVLGGLLDTGMTLYLENTYGLNSLGAGLVFIGAVAPSFVASPFAGFMADKYGAKGISSIGLFMSVPTYSLLIIKGPLALFVVFLVMVGFSISFFLTPIIQDLSVVVESIPGIGSEHVYSIFNLVYSIGAFIGPLCGGQIISGLKIQKGWITLCILSSSLSLLLLPPVVIYVGGNLRDGYFMKSSAVEVEETKEVKQEVV